MTKGKKITRKNIILRICIFAFVIYSAFTLVDMQVEIASCRQRLADLNASIEAQTLINNDLERQLQNSGSEETIERIARDRLDFVYPNEKVFIDISGS